MTAIIIPRRHYTQPQGRVELDLSHFLLKNLYQGVLANGRTLVGDYVSPENWLAPETVTNFGVASNLNGAGAFISSKTVVKAQPWTLVAVGVPRSSGQSAIVTHSNEGPGHSTRDQSLQIESNGQVSAYLYDGGEKRAFSGYTSQAGDLLVCGGAYISGTLTCFANGKFGSTAVINSGYTGYVNPSLVWGYGGSYSGQATSQLNLLFGFKFAGVAWSRDMFNELYANPWQLFRADPIRIYSLPTGAITLNSLTASNITQTTARITLGLTR